MRSPGILRAGVAATACWLAGAALASAMVLWCESDPPIQVVTPAGTNLTVNNMIYVPRYDMHLATHFPVSAAAAADGHGGTPITVHVHVARGVSLAHGVSLGDPQPVASPGDGTGGTAVPACLDVPTTS